MRRLMIAALSVAAVLSTVDLAQARDGCGPGRFYDGYRCAPMGGGGYGRGYYDDGPVYRGGGRQLGPGNRAIGNGMIQNWRGEVGCTRPGFTVQDGVCKPYRGY